MFSFLMGLPDHPTRFPDEADWQSNGSRLVASFRKWLDVRGGGGPPTRLINRADKPLPTYDDRQDRLLNRYNLHTRHCPYCLGVSTWPAMQVRIWHGRPQSTPHGAWHVSTCNPALWRLGARWSSSLEDMVYDSLPVNGPSIYFWNLTCTCMRLYCFAGSERVQAAAACQCSSGRSVHAGPIVGTGSRSALDQPSNSDPFGRCG